MLVEYECWVCGKAMPRYGEPTERIFCEGCYAEFDKARSETLKEYVRLRTLVMHERALRIMEKQKMPMHEYKEAAEAVLEKALTDENAFSSSHEIIAAIVFVENHVKIKPKYRIANYTVDFYIEEYKIILEINGYMHKHMKIKDNQRDIEIRNALGKEWEIVRIPTKYIEENAAALVDAIEQIADYKRKIRKQNAGIIPDWYSEREKMHYAEIIGKTKAVN